MRVAKKAKKQRVNESPDYSSSVFEWRATKDGKTRRNIPIQQILDEYDKVSHPTNEQISAIGKILLAIKGQPENPMKRLKIYDECVPLLLEVTENFDAYACRSKELLESTWNNQGIRRNKRWTEEEDEELIEFIAHDWGIGVVASLFGRTPSAIASRVSYLVGIERVSQEIAGRFVGTLNGQHIHGMIDGELQKV